LPLESEGESEFELADESSEVELLLDVLELPGVLVLVELPEEAACAATPTASVPARLAATSPPVIAVVRLRPVSRSIMIPLFVDDSTNCAGPAWPEPVPFLCTPCQPPPITGLLPLRLFRLLRIMQ